MKDAIISAIFETLIFLGLGALIFAGLLRLILGPTEEEKQRRKML